MCRADCPRCTAHIPSADSVQSGGAIGKPGEDSIPAPNFLLSTPVMESDAAANREAGVETPANEGIIRTPSGRLVVDEVDDGPVERDNPRLCIQRSLERIESGATREDIDVTKHRRRPFNRGRGALTMFRSSSHRGDYGLEAPESPGDAGSDILHPFNDGRLERPESFHRFCRAESGTTMSLFADPSPRARNSDATRPGKLPFDEA